MDDLIAQDLQLFHHHHHSPPVATVAAALPNPKRIKLDTEYNMPYQRPVYQQYPQHQQQHYQHRVMHAPGPAPPNVYTAPQARQQQQQHFVQNHNNVHGTFNQSFNRPMTGFIGNIHQATQPAHPPASRVTNTLTMDSNNYDGAMSELGYDGGGGGGGNSSSFLAGGHASQNFPNEEYYCEDRASPVYRHQNLSQKLPDAFDQVYDQDHYDNNNTTATGDFQTDDCVSANVPQLISQRPRVGVYHEYAYQMHHDHQPQFGVMHPGMQQQQQHNLQRQQRSRYYKAPDEFHSHNEQPLGPYERLAPTVYPDDRVNLISDEYSDDFQQPPPPMRQDYIHRQAATTTSRMGRFEASHYADRMDSPQDSQRLYQHASNEQQRQQQHYTLQPEQLVRQEMGLNPRKISRVSASAITSPVVASYQSATRHQPMSANDQYPSGDTDTYRVVVSSSPDESTAHDEHRLAPQQPYSSTAPFVESVSSDQTEEYSSFESLPPVAPAGPSNEPPSQRDRPRSQPQQISQVTTTQQHQRQQRHQQANYIDMRSSGTVSQDWLDMICRHMIEHMNNFGICVIDNFLGSIKGESILSEVLQLYSQRNYTSGRLVSDARDDEDESESGAADDKATSAAAAAAAASERQQKLAMAAADPARLIRNDRVIWVDGCEDGCSEINNLIQTLCSVITNSSRLSLYTGNALDKIVINKRTKAHVACYPGNRTRYIKHVDNPNNDGRVITAIYYLNKNWSTKRDGGLLRMFPAGMDTVANIEPLFDRVLFFWADRRNPHEVLPAFRDRFAITVWYIASETSR